MNEFNKSNVQRGPLRKSRYFTAVGAASDSGVHPGNLTLLKINFSRLHGDYPLTNQIHFTAFDLVINNSVCFKEESKTKNSLIALSMETFLFAFLDMFTPPTPRNYEIDVIDS